MKKETKAARLFAEAITRIDGPSTKAWATSDHNKPVWLKIAAGYVGKPDAACRLSIDIMTTAMGM